MTDQTAAQEPTMEEILASIRRIISEDDAPAETATAAAPPSEPDAEPEAPSPALMDETPSMQEPEAAEEDVLELTEAYEPPAAESIGDLEVSAAEPEPFPSAPVSESVFAAEPAEAHTPEHPSVPTTNYDSLVGDSAAASAASAFAGFASALKKPEPADMDFPSGPTIDEMVRGLLRPMLKEWLDANLPAIVEAQVRKEVERIARTAG
ncbi:DUF2497 domain-containing protein [Brevundimonas sp.]|uniref:DUF2497 domain-containing protein n=1 Tax=Brevundimonas sp. TaxID=1871086 RepID=UPI002FCB23E2